MDVLIKSKRQLIGYNLQLFAEGMGGEKTEAATPKRKEKAREEGQVAKSMEITTALFFVMMFSTIKIIGADVTSDLVQSFKEFYSLFSLKTMDIKYASGLIGYAIKLIMRILTPVFVVSFLIAFVSNYIQVGWHPTLKPMAPKLNKISPLSGLKRLFSMKPIVELIKSLLKVIIIVVIAYFTLRDYQNTILMLYDLTVFESYGLVANLVLDLGIRVGAFFTIIALIDYIYQRLDLNKNLKMSKYEIKQEYKEAEGNPEIKSKIRQKMREASMRRMMQDLPKADVIITNPTHFAVALQYNTDQQGAPIVLAKGADLVAFKIKEVGKQNNIEIVEHKLLARTIFYSVEIGEEIPPELYQTVAEILAFVYNLKNK